MVSRNYNCVFYDMSFSFQALSYRQKSMIAELAMLFFLTVLSPLAVGLQIFSKFSHTLSLIFVNLLGIPAILLFYRLYLPHTIGKQRYVTALLVFPFYIALYEVNVRIAAIITGHLPFIPADYRAQILSGHPEDFSQGYFNQTFGYTCLLLLALTSLYMMKVVFKKQHDLYEVKTAKLLLELNQLKTQVQPHFFFNTLNNLYSLTIKNSPKAPVMVADLSKIMRYLLYDTQHDKVPLEQETAFISSYIHLENLRHDQEKIIDFQIQGDIENIKVAPLLFLPLIENTFKHALHQEMPEKWVKLVLTADEREVIFQATNPILHNNNGHQVKAGGIGLSNVRKRLELIYPDQHELVIHKEEYTYTVTLIINHLPVK
jgi:two-component system, LytTR family, sensor kinase